MSNAPHPPDSTPRVDSLWGHIGGRLAKRRQELGLGVPAVAVHLGVDVQTYGAFESGRSQIPAVALADLADLFKVPIFYFFQDMPLGIDEPATTQRIPAPVLTVATQAERVASLAEEFKKLGWQEQQYVLMFARALSRPAS